MTTQRVGIENVLLGSVDSDIETLQRDGIVAHKRAFTREFVEQMREDMMTAFWTRSSILEEQWDVARDAGI